MTRLAFIAVLSATLIACNGGDGDADGGNGDSGSGDDGSASNCPDISGTWQLSYTCEGSTGGSGGSAMVEVTQTACEVTLTQPDDNTPQVWTSTGPIDPDGNTSLAGEFGFTSAETCTGTVSGNNWTGECLSEDWNCEFEADKP